MLVIGPSGSGKSTLALAIAGLIPREIPAIMTGQLDLGGHDVRELGATQVAAQVGIVFQDPEAQLVMERVEDDVAFGLENRGWAPATMAARVPEALTGMGLEGLERRRSRRLSGGQQQRLALAGVLAPRPRVLVLDEPTANLDPPGAGAFMARLRALREERSTTIVLVEHRVEDAWPLADVILALDHDGATIDVGRPDVVEARSGRRLRDTGIWLPAAVEARLANAPRRAAAVRGASPAGPSSDDVPTPVHTEIVRATDLRFGYERTEPVLRDIQLVAGSGERIALVGPNGGGKSTLGRLLVGLLRPDAGVVELLGDDPSRLAPAELARRAAYVFQQPERQFLAERVGDEVMVGLRPSERAAACQLMDRLGLPLERFADRSPYRLSGGEQRRLSLACALVRDPHLVVLDEPTFGQDRANYESLLEILRERVSAGACIVMATHDERLVADLASRVITLDEGWIVRDELVVRP